MPRSQRDQVGASPAGDLVVNRVPHRAAGQMASIQEHADEVDSLSTRLALLETWLPLALVVIGVVLIVVAIVRHKATIATPTEPTDSSTAAPPTQ